MGFIKWLFGKKEFISDRTIKHSSLGEFNTKGRLKSGGHGQKNIEELERLNVKYNITKEYINGVRVGNIPTHINKFKRTKENQSWFPKNWTNKTIIRAAQVVSRGKKYSDGKVKQGHYGEVNVGIIRTNGKISTIFPMNVQKNKKGVELNERTKTKRINFKKKKHRSSK